MKWYWFVIIIFLLFLFFVGMIKQRWKKKHSGEKIKTKKIWTLFWKGVEGVTPIQIAVSQLFGSYTVFVGIIFGLVTSFFIVFFPKVQTGAIGFITQKPVWFFIIMLGSFILTILQLISSIQKYRRIKLIDEQIDWLNNQDLMKKVYEEFKSGKSFKQIKSEMKMKIKKLHRYYEKYSDQIKIEELEKNKDEK